MTQGVLSLPTASNLTQSDADHLRLLQGEVLVAAAQPQDGRGAAAKATMYLPISRSQAWEQLTNYSRWVHYFPDIVQSEVLEHDPHHPHRGYRLYQVAKKNFIVFTAQVEVYLRVFENMQRQIRFRMERGSFGNFSATLSLDDAGAGTILTYAVEATPLVTIPHIFIEQAIVQALPMNMQQMRQALSQVPQQAA